MNRQPVQDVDDAGDEAGISGKWILLALAVAAVVAIVLAFTLVRPDPDRPVARPADRPFGPASREEQQRATDEVPLVLKPPPSAAPPVAPAPPPAPLPSD